MTALIFRFFFIYFILSIAPWLWFNFIPGFSIIANLYADMEEPFVHFVNAHLLHVKPKLNITGNGSGDTSYAWAQYYTYLLLSAIGSIIWAWIDRRRLQPRQGLKVFLWTLLRYYIAMAGFSYGIIKLFALQMPFPNLHQLATPLGDLLPMRLSWMFMGYSTTYQFFSGIAEVIVGLLLINRRTVTLGAMAAVGVFLNVFVMNLSYDIPVKLYSMQLVICSLALVAFDWRRLWNFFVTNQPVEPDVAFAYVPAKKWQRYLLVGLKILLVTVLIGLPIMESFGRLGEGTAETAFSPIERGVYYVTEFKKNNAPVAVTLNDTMAWKDFIFDTDGMGSVNTQDTLFRQRYRRGYFDYRIDTLNQIITFRKFKWDSLPMFQLSYMEIDDRRLQLWGEVKNDSLHFELVRSDRQFQLAERQFHWISEANR